MKRARKTPSSEPTVIIPANILPIQPAESFFASPCVTACSRAVAPHVTIPGEIWDSLLDLAARDPVEWLVFLTGISTPEHVSVSGVHVPAQSRGCAHVELEAGLAPEGCVGKLHSHNTMPAFFSSTDQEHFNWPLEIVVNGRREFAAVARVRLPCGEMMYVDVQIEVLPAQNCVQWRAELARQTVAAPAVAGAVNYDMEIDDDEVDTWLIRYGDRRWETERRKRLGRAGLAPMGGGYRG